VIAPSNPVLSIWPILAVPGIRDCGGTRSAPWWPSVRSSAGGPIKGPAAEAMRGVGLSNDLAGIIDAYGGIVSHLVIDTAETTDPPARGWPSSAPTP
jgi:LPPG:FO 2-phospho-L-lactate transferase